MLLDPGSFVELDALTRHRSTNSHDSDRPTDRPGRPGSSRGGDATGPCVARPRAAVSRWRIRSAVMTVCGRAVGWRVGMAQAVAVVGSSRCCCRLLSSHPAAAAPMVAAVQAVNMGGSPGCWEAPVVKPPWGVKMARVVSVAV